MDRSTIEFKVAFNVIKSANFAESNGFCDVTIFFLNLNSIKKIYIIYIFLDKKGI